MNVLYRLAWLLIPLAIVAPVAFFLGRAFASLLAGMPA
jgi:hypothetical protein